MANYKQKTVFGDTLKNFLLIFMSKFAASVLKNSHFLAEIYFIFRQNVIHQTSKTFNTKCRPQLKKSEKWFSTKANFSNFLKSSCSDFRLKLY